MWSIAAVLGALMACWVAVASAQPTGFDAAQWLRRVQQAASAHSYRGTMVFSGGGVVSSSRVGHLIDGRQRYERIEMLGGPTRQQFRHNDTVLTLWPRTRLAVFEPMDPVTDFPALPTGGSRLLGNYDLRWTGEDRIAGLVADVVIVKPRDALRFAQRLWAERESGLLMRADVLGPRGDILETSAFTDIVLGERLPVDSVVGPMKRLEGYRVMRPQVQRVPFDAEGWTLQPAVSGFQLVSCARRMLDDMSGAGDGRQVLQAVFSDGLTHVSVFIEPYDGQRHRPIRTSQGATHTSMGRHGEWWVTIVGDVPMSTVQMFDAALQRR